jgi:hypothetical protein
MGYEKTMCGTRGLKYWVDSSGSATSRIPAASTSAECLISCSPRIYQCDCKELPKQMLFQPDQNKCGKDECCHNFC